MKFKRQGVNAMHIALFVGGICLGTVFGFVIMALLVASGDHCLCEEVQVIGSGFACAYPPTLKVSPVLENRPQAFGAYLTPER
jgi:hypothetical protein